MMVTKRWLATACCLLMLTGMRDPFRPPENRCQTVHFSRWRYQGVIRMRHRDIGLLRDAQGRWRRVEEGDRLPGGWRVTRVVVAEIVISNGAGCEPWRWRRGENENEAMDSAGAGSHDTAGKSGEARRGNAGGG